MDGSTKTYNSCSVGNGKLFRFVDEIDVKPGRKDNRALPIMASMLFPRGAPQAWSPGIASPCIPLQDTLECSSLIRVCVIYIIIGSAFRSQYVNSREQPVLFMFTQ